MIIIVIIVINNTNTLKPFFSQSQVGLMHTQISFLKYFNNFVAFCVSQFYFCVIYVHKCLCNTKVLRILITYLCEGGFGTCSVMSPDLEVLMAHRKLAPAGFLEDAFLIAARSALPSSGDPSSVVTLMRPSAMLERRCCFQFILKYILIFYILRKEGVTQFAYLCDNYYYQLCRQDTGYVDPDTYPYVSVFSF